MLSFRLLDTQVTRRPYLAQLAAVKSGATQMFGVNLGSWLVLFCLHPLSCLSFCPAIALLARDVCLHPIGSFSKRGVHYPRSNMKRNTISLKCPDTCCADARL